MQKLAGEAGVELPKWSPEDEAREEKKKSLYDDRRAGLRSSSKISCARRSAATARDYLQSRGLERRAGKRFRLGYAPTGKPRCIEHLNAKNITLDDMIAAGLVRAADDEPRRRAISSSTA